MPRSQTIDPGILTDKGFLEMPRIPVMAYDRPISEERAQKGDAALIGMFSDMAIIREFEGMLNAIKREGAYRGMAYNHPGPAHLSLGQEASAVGQAYALTPDDFIFGSHRSHGEILAKGLSAIAKMDDDTLMRVMRSCLDGAILRVVEKAARYDSVKELATAFLLYGTLSEIFARETGFHRGLGGSMHAFFVPFGVYPNNAIVGGSGDIATGAALFKRVNRTPGIVVSNLGDGSLGCGPVWEAMNFAAMDQYRELWDESHRGGLPILFNFFNNSYGMGGQTRGETMGYREVARVAAGMSPDGLHAERVNGFNPLAVADAVARKKALLLEGKGPTLLDVVTYRFCGHSPSDASSYRTPEEIAAWQAVDPMITYRAALVEAGVAAEGAFEELLERAAVAVTAAVKLAIDDSVSPRMNLTANPDAIADLMFSGERIPSMAPKRRAETLVARGEDPRSQMIAKRQRFAFDEKGAPYSKNRLFQLRDGIFEAVRDKFYEDATLIAYGEDNRDWGGAFAVYRGLTEMLPYHRFFNSPISEGAIVGSAVGYAMAGGRALVELMYCDFLGRAGDEIFNQMAKWQAMSAGILKMPVVLRVSVGSKYGAQHSQDWSALVAHIPGLKAVFPATPYDAKGLMNAALSGSDPVVFFESQRIYDVGEQFHEGGVPEGYYEIPIGLPDVKRAGTDITILSIGATLYRVIEAADILRDKYGLSAEIIDARSLTPFDYAPVIESVRKTGRIVLTSDACERGSFINDMARNITQMCFDDLDAPPVVVGARNWITPAYEFDGDFFPQPSWILDAIHQQILPLRDYVPAQSFTPLTSALRAKKGV
ncbi:MAG: dehydrogenase [Clostridiales bacterium]|nr:dehydrogenase [Clostridiales bacterium]